MKSGGLYSPYILLSVALNRPEGSGNTGASTSSHNHRSNTTYDMYGRRAGSVTGGQELQERLFGGCSVKA